MDPEVVVFSIFGEPCLGGSCFPVCLDSISIVINVSKNGSRCLSGSNSCSMLLDTC